MASVPAGSAIVMPCPGQQEGPRETVNFTSPLPAIEVMTPGPI